MLFGDDYKEFIREHRNDNPARLRLRFHGDPRPWLPFAINNIAALRKAGKFRLHDGKDFTPGIIPLEVSAQQSTSADIALLHANLAKDSHSVLDMTFGLGMDARMLSLHPARKILGFDLNEILAEAANENFREIRAVEIRHGDSVKFLKEYDGAPFDLIFIDPARRGKEGERLFNLHDCQPDLIDILPLLKAKSHRIMAKLSPMLDITQTIRDLPGVSEIHVVEENGECKELLAVINSVEADRKASAVPVIFIDRFTGNGFRQFTFTRHDETSASEKLSGTGNLSMHLPQAGEYLFEPSSATMKAAPFNLLSERLDVCALHPNTHIYTSPEDAVEFPGARYEIIESTSLSSSALKRLGKSIGQADIAVRNLKGFTPETLRKRLKIKQGGNLRLYALSVATPDGTIPALILVKPA